MMDAITKYESPTINIDELERMGHMFALSGYFGTGREADVGAAQMAVKIMAGREIGFEPFASVNGIHIINGKPTIGANLMAAAIDASDVYDYAVDWQENKDGNKTACTVTIYRNGKARGSETFSLQDAEQAGLIKKGGNWDKYPRNMLFARAMSNAVRFYAPALFGGNAVYTPDELGGQVDESGDVVDVSPQVTFESPPQRTEAPQEELSAPKAIDEPEMPQNGAQGDFDELPSWDSLNATEQEVTFLKQHASPPKLQAWAMDVGACANEHEARNSWKKIVNGHSIQGGSEQMKVAMLLFYRRQLEKMGSELDDESHRLGIEADIAAAHNRQ